VQHAAASRRGTRTWGAILGLCVVLCAPATGARAVAPPLSLTGLSGNGRQVLIDTLEPFSPHDRNGRLDTYRRAGGETHLALTGLADYKRPTVEGSSTDGSRLFFDTDMALVPSDTDNNNDVYQLEDGRYRELSIAPGRGNNRFHRSDFFGATPDGRHVYFLSDDVLVPGQPVLPPTLAHGRYLYERADGVTRFLSFGHVPALELAAVARDGSHVYLWSYLSLEGDETRYLLEAHPGNDAPTLITEDYFFGSQILGLTTGGEHFLFSSDKPLAADDHNSGFDVYERHDGVNHLRTPAAVGHGGAVASRDLTAIAFSTNAQLSPSDTDSSEDIYLLKGSTTTLVSQGPSGGNGAVDAAPLAIAPDDSHVVFKTAEALTAGDLDASEDIYSGDGTATDLVSTGPAESGQNRPATFDAESTDGGVVFSTAAGLVPEDMDTAVDLYRRTGAATELLSAGPFGGNAAMDAHFLRATADGSHVLFETPEELTIADTDFVNDFYDRERSATHLVSTGRDLTPPNTSITSGPANGDTTGPSPIFEFTSTERGSTFRCQIDAASPTTCSSPFSPGPLVQGPHTFRVRARDMAGNADPTEAKRSFTVGP
jgi:hypothetical protein